jgi:hypothetical protein
MIATVENKGKRGSQNSGKGMNGEEMKTCITVWVLDNDDEYGLY